MIELVQKSSSKISLDDDEYKKMQQRILTIITQSIQDEIFYEQRFNVKLLEEKKNNSLFLYFRHVILFSKLLLIFLVII